MNTGRNHEGDENMLICACEAFGSLSETDEDAACPPARLSDEMLFAPPQYPTNEQELRFCSCGPRQNGGILAAKALLIRCDMVLVTLKSRLRSENA
jgi:hypothetical protein